MSASLPVATTALELDDLLSQARDRGEKVALVATMGALHEGHLSLVDAAKQQAEFVVVSIFVNPTQFGAGEDFDKYPRTLEQDLAKLEGIASAVFAPSVETVYPGANATSPTVAAAALASGVVTPRLAGPVGKTFEGAARPGHFDGMLTVVGRLFDLVKPDVAVFGEKDAQQLFLIQRMVDEHYPQIEIVAAETVREPSGLALSSRNRFLNAEQTDIAEILAITLATVDQLIHEKMPVAEALNIGREMIAGEPETKLEYLELVDLATFEPIGERHPAQALLIVAAIVGNVRLIDNHHIKL